MSPDLARLLEDSARIETLSDVEVRQLLVRVSALLTALSARIGTLRGDGQAETATITVEHLQQLSVSRVAELLGIPKARVYELIRKGKIPGSRFGKTVRVPLAGLREVLARQQAEGLDQLTHGGQHRRPGRRSSGGVGSFRDQQPRGDVGSGR